MIYSAPTVSYEPSCEVYGWKIVQLVDSEGTTTRHVAAIERGECGRCSTPVVEDRGATENMHIFTTLSGRVYKCHGEEVVSLSPTVQRVLNAYKWANRLEEIC